MGYEIQTQTGQPSDTIQFTFREPLQAYALGIGKFTLYYGSATTNHWVEQMSISLQTNQPEPAQVASNVLSVTLQAQLKDNDGHYIDIANSSISVVCVANTGSLDNQTALANVLDVTQKQPREVQIPSATGLTVLTTCLSGFDLNYDTTDHEFQGATASSGISPQPTGQGLIEATAKIWDGSGNLASGSIDAGVLASTDTPAPFMAQQVKVMSGTGIGTKLSFPSPVGQVAALIQSFNVQYATGDEPLSNITVGCDSASATGSTVTLGYSYAWFTDGYGNSQDDSLSYVNLLVVGVPLASASDRS